MIDFLRHVVLFSFLFGVWYFILRKKYRKKYSLVWFFAFGFWYYLALWLRGIKTDWKKILKTFCFTVPVIIFLYFLLPYVNAFAEGLAGGEPSVEPGHNPIATLARISPYLLLVVSISVPAVEEWIFRGLILEEFKRKWGTLIALILSAGIFSAIHLTNIGYTPYAIFVPFVSGLVFGAVYLKFGLLGAWMTHGGNNALFTLVWMFG